MSETISEYDLEQMYSDMLDDCYGTVEVAGITFDASSVLKECDPIAYRVGMNDYADSLMEDGYRVEGYE